MGIIGFGRIGRRIGEIANTLGMRLLVFNPSRKSTPKYSHFKWVSLEEIFKDSDFISINSPLTSGNEGFVNIKLLSMMKRSAFIINTARGKLINEKDLAKTLNSGKIAGAAVDVVSEEPIKTDNPLLNAKNIIITPHIAWASIEARKRIMNTAASNIRNYLADNMVNTI